MAESSSASARHPQPLDTDNLMGVDVLLLTGLTHEPQLPPDMMLQELCGFVGSCRVANHYTTPHHTTSHYTTPRHTTLCNILLIPNK